MCFESICGACPSRNSSQIKREKRERTDKNEAGQRARSLAFQPTRSVHTPAPPKSPGRRSPVNAQQHILKLCRLAQANWSLSILSGDLSLVFVVFLVRSCSSPRTVVRGWGLCFSSGAHNDSIYFFLSLFSGKKCASVSH